MIVPVLAKAASDDEAFLAEREQELLGMLSAEAAADPARLVAGLTPESSDAERLTAARAVAALAQDAPEGFAAALAAELLGQRLAADVAGAFADPAAVLEARAAGELDRETLERAGLDSAALAPRSPLFAQLGEFAPARVDALARSLLEPRTTWQQETWDTYGLVLQLAYLALASESAELAAWIFPHDFRILAEHVALRTVGPVTEGDVENGRTWTQIYMDILVGVAFSNHGLTDALVLQLPVSLYFELSWRCTSYLWGTCVGWAFTTVTGPGDTLIATNAAYRFAYPLDAGEFPTRATGQDLLQSVYDRLGTLPYQVPTEFLARSQTPDTPGLADLGTQAPAVSHYGTQLPAELEGHRGMFRHARVHTQVAAPIAALPVWLGPLGPIAGYEATEVRAYEIAILIVRWHNVGIETAGDLLPSSPATFYYDVPAGEYKVTDARTDAYGGVHVRDWRLVDGLPVTV